MKNIEELNEAFKIFSRSTSITADELKKGSIDFTKKMQNITKNNISNIKKASN